MHRLPRSKSNATFCLIASFLAIFAPSIAHSTEAKTEPEIKRIIALAPHIVEILYALDAGDRIVGTVEHADYPEEAKEIPVIGGYHGLNMEKILAAQPDLVITWANGNRTQDLEQLQRLGLRTYDSEPTDPSQIATEIEQIGELIGATEKAATIAADLRQQFQQIHDRYADQRPVTVFYQMWHDPIRTVGPGSWVQNLLSYCNARNIFDDADSDYPMVTTEAVITRKPEVIIIPGPPDTDSSGEKYWQRWLEIPAVANDHIYGADGDRVHRFTPRVVQGLRVLCGDIDRVRGDG